MPVVTLYTRQGCHLCEEAKQEIEQLRSVTEFRFEILDIDADPELQARFTNEVPVVFINGRKAFKYRVDRKQFLRRLRYSPRMHRDAH